MAYRRADGGSIDMGIADRAAGLAGRLAGKGKVLRIALAIASAVVLAVLLAIFFVNQLGRMQLGLGLEEKGGQPKLGEGGVVTYDGKTYRYNEGIYTIYCMGIDTADDMGTEGGIPGMGGQSDANFLAVVDTVNHKLEIIAIPRDSMTQIERYDVEGEYYDTVEAQLTLQYSYGGGGTRSCELMEERVSEMFYGLPIHGYAAVSLNAIKNINGGLGGVPVEVLYDISNDEISLKQGESVLLDNEQAYLYVQGRDCNEQFSAYQRLQRQKQYLVAAVEKALLLTERDPSIPLALYQSISDSVLTDLSASEIAYLAMESLDCDFSEDSLYIVPGEQQAGAVYEEYRVDQEALLRLILDVFYIPGDS